MTELTVIVPFYDETAYLRTTLKSILSQRIDGIQIIVVNDNPERFSPSDLAALGVTGAIELIQHPRNLGLSAARNSAMRQARGRFIGFLDGDDYYTLGGLAHQLERAHATRADITHAPTWFTHMGSPKVHLLPRDAAYFCTARTVQGLKGAEEAQFITSSWSSLYRRDFLTQNNLWFDQEQPRFEDRLFVLHTVTRARVITFTGVPNRVWRGRKGSISVTATTPDTHRLQLQLLEKSLTHIRAEVAAGRLKPRFEKRELFNTISRLIWDLDLIEAITRNKHDPDKTDPTYHDLAARIPPLLGTESFGQAIFDDPVLAPINRVGMRTRKGHVTRTAFFAIHLALREGDFDQAWDLIKTSRGQPKPRQSSDNTPRAPRAGFFAIDDALRGGDVAKARSLIRTSRARLHSPSRKAPRLVLHLGLHKTGSTYIQHHLSAHRDRLARHGILVPETGFDGARTSVRKGATPGHQGLVTALRRDDPAPWEALAQEIEASKADTVVLSCENMGFPIDNDRDAMIQKLADRLDMFDQVDLLALVRRPDIYPEAFFRELVANGTRIAAEGITGFLADHAETLSNLATLFAPFEQQFDTRVQLADFDAFVAGDGLWPGFTALAGLPDDLPTQEVDRYATPDRDTVNVLHLLNTLVPDITLRTDILKGWFALHPEPDSAASLLSPTQRLHLIDLWQDKSATFAAERGYAPDLASARAALAEEEWNAPDAISLGKLRDLIGLANQSGAALFGAASPASPPAQRPADPPPQTARRDGVVLTLRLRPWARSLMRRLRGSDTRPR